MEKMNLKNGVTDFYSLVLGVYRRERVRWSTWLGVSIQLN